MWSNICFACELVYIKTTINEEACIINAEAFSFFCRVPIWTYPILKCQKNEKWEVQHSRCVCFFAVDKTALGFEMCMWRTQTGTVWSDQETSGHTRWAPGVTVRIITFSFTETIGRRENLKCTFSLEVVLQNIKIFIGKTGKVTEI